MICFLPKSLRIFCISFFLSESVLCIYQLVVGGSVIKFNLLHNYQWINISHPVRPRLMFLLYEFPECTYLIHYLITLGQFLGIVSSFSFFLSFFPLHLIIGPLFPFRRPFLINYFFLLNQLDLELLAQC